MSFVVEDGTGLPSANAYISTTYFRDYHRERGNTYSAGSTAIQQAIIRATDYIDGGRYLFVGLRKLTTQALEWPRIDARYRDDDRAALGVPPEVQKACAELALRTVDATQLAPDPEYDDSGRFVEAKTEMVGPITESTRYSQGGSPATFKRYPRVDKLLRFLLVSGNELLRS